MSDTSKHDSNAASPSGLPLDEATIGHLKACQKITVEQARPLFDDFMEAACEKLIEFIDKARSNEEVRQLQEVVRLLRRSETELNQRFVTSLGDGFIRFKNKRLNTRSGEERYRQDRLALVDNEDLEESIALASIANRADEQFSQPLWFLHQRLAVLNQGEAVQEGNNPASPVQFCEAMRKSLASLALDMKTRIIAYKVFESALNANLGSILEDLNRYLAGQGILPNLRPSHSIASSTATPEAPEAPAVDPGEAPASTISPEQEQAGLIQAIRTLQQHIADAGRAPASVGGQLAASPAHFPGSGHSQGHGHLQNHGPSQNQGQAYSGNFGQASHPMQSPGSPAAPGGMFAAPVVYSNQQLVTALQDLQSHALALTTGISNVPGAAAPPSVQQVSQQLVQQLQEQSPDGEVDPTDMHTIDLVGMLFDYMLSDEQLPDSVKALLSYLHTPFLKMAFLDASFFEKAEHPARLLLNNLAEAGTRWVSNDGSSQYDMFAKIKQIVSRVLEDFENDVRLFAELLLEFSAYVKKIGRRQDLMEKRAMEKAEGEDKLREVKLRVNREIRSRTDGKELPSAVLLLLLQPWSDYLAFLLLRYGDKSESWSRAVAAVDEILWSIDSSDSADRDSRLDRLDNLLDLIESGFETIGYDQGKAKKLIEALLSLQKMAMQSRKPAPAPAPIRSKLESEAVEKAGGAPEADTAMTPEEQKMVQNLKMIEFGTWFEFEGGKRLKVAWYNSKTMQYMLVDQMGKKVAMKSGLELARGMLEGKARVIAGSTKPFFERALENILQNLNAKAGAIQPESSHV